MDPNLHIHAADCGWVFARLDSYREKRSRSKFGCYIRQPRQCCGSCLFYRDGFDGDSGFGGTDVCTSLCCYVKICVSFMFMHSCTSFVPLRCFFAVYQYDTRSIVPYFLIGFHFDLSRSHLGVGVVNAGLKSLYVANASRFVVGSVQLVRLWGFTITRICIDAFLFNFCVLHQVHIRMLDCQKTHIHVL